MIIPFLTSRWQKLTPEQLAFLTPRADLRFRQGYPLGWGRRFSLITLDNGTYALNSAYGLYHLEHLVEWLTWQAVTAADYSNYLNQGMKEIGLQ